jgi:type IV pilus assembly protein PilB
MSHEEAIDFEQIEAETEIASPEIFAGNLLEWAVERQASDLFISDGEQSVSVGIRRLGRVEHVRKLTREFGRRLQGHVRVLAGGDPGEMLRPTEGRGITVTPGGREIDLRLSSMPTLHGQDVSIRLFDPVSGVRSLDELGYDDTELEMIRELLRQPSGLILVAGPVASGKSSTLYAMVDELNDGSRKIHTLEDPIEHSIPGVIQSQINERANLGFAELLSTVLRHSPDVIMIGEIRDSRTAATAIRAGASGQLVLSTIHARSAAEAIDSMLHYGVDPKAISQALLGAISQRLVGKICPECGEKASEQSPEIDERVANRLGDQSAELWKTIGCDACFGHGFSKMTCVPEILSINRSLKDVIASGSTAVALEDAARNSGMLCMAESLAARVYRGETTAHEAHRVIPAPQFARLRVNA